MKPIQFRGKETMSYNKTEQPTAVGAEEILKKIECKEHIGGYWLYYEENVIEAMTEFATLHAQRLAEKMVEERMRATTERCKKLEFMIENGLGWEDMRNDITMPHEI